MLSPLRYVLILAPFLAAMCLAFLVRKELPPPVAKASHAEGGAALFQRSCVQCHGAKGQGDPQFRTPNIAGLPAWYIERQIHNFQDGRRGMNPADSPGFMMASIAKNLTAAEMKAAAHFVESLPRLAPPQPTALVNPDVEEGRYIFTERCMECHRYNASGEMTFGSPPLTGQPDWYLLAQISKFKSGDRGVDPNDPNGTKMSRSSQFIESEQAKNDVVAFIMSLNQNLQEASVAPAAETPADFGHVDPVVGDAAGK